MMTRTGHSLRQRSKMLLAETFRSLSDTCNWEPEYEDSFYLGIIAAGFNRVTLQQAFVLAQIVESTGPISVRGGLYRASGKVYPNTDKACYNSAQRIILKLRRKGIISRGKICDSTRRRLKPSSWADLGDFMDTINDAYRKDLWSRQKEYVEVFVEKDAMAGLIEPVTSRYDVYFNIIRGDSSDTFIWDIADQWNRIHKPICAYYLGDHDPSGLRIEQTIKSKLAAECLRPFKWVRLGVTDEDFRNPRVQGFPLTSRKKKEFKTSGAEKAWCTKNDPYLAQYGDRCVEIDALDPRLVRHRLGQAIESHIDMGEWKRLQEVEKLERNSVKQFVLAQQVGGGD